MTFFFCFHCWLTIASLLMQSECCLCCLRSFSGFAGQLLSAEEVTGCEDKRHGEAGEGLKAGKGRNPNAKHWLHVNWGSSSCSEKWFGKVTTYFSCLHQQRWKDCSKSSSREALATHWLGPDSSWNYSWDPTLPHLNKVSDSWNWSEVKVVNQRCGRVGNCWEQFLFGGGENSLYFLFSFFFSYLFVFLSLMSLLWWCLVAFFHGLGLSYGLTHEFNSC